MAFEDLPPEQQAELRARRLNRREWAEHVKNRLGDVVDDPAAPANAMVLAADKLLDRLEGKPVQMVINSEVPVQMIVNKDDEQL